MVVRLSFSGPDAGIGPELAGTVDPTVSTLVSFLRSLGRSFRDSAPIRQGWSNPGPFDRSFIEL